MLVRNSLLSCTAIAILMQTYSFTKKYDHCKPLPVILETDFEVKRKFYLYIYWAHIGVTHIWRTFFDAFASEEQMQECETF